MKITRQSRMTNQWHTLDIDVTPEELQEIDKPNRRILIQNIVPHLTASEREFLMTGITDAEWDMIKEPDDAA
jgi:hypothetical protein